MFLAIVLHPHDATVAVQQAVGYHWERLAETGFTGELMGRFFPGGSVFWDGGSSHADMFDDASGGFLLRGGYLAGEDGWLSDGSHLTEHPSAWGEFAALRFRVEGSVRTVRVFADPAGSWPIYHGQRRGWLVASNDALFVGVVLGHTRICAQAAFEVLGYGHALGSETTIDGVRRLFPGERIDVKLSESAVIEVSIGGASSYEYRLDGRSAEARIESTIQALRSSIADIPPLNAFQHATVQLSGGLDSRLTAAVLASVRTERPDAVTLDLSDSAETRIAADVAQELGYTHRIVRLGQMSRAAARAGWLLTGGQVSVHAAAGNVLSYETASVGPLNQIVIVGGWPGDCLIGSYVPLLPGMTSRVLANGIVRDWARKRGPNWSERGIRVSGPGSGSAARAALRKMQDRLVSASGRDAAQKISFWAMFVRQPAFSYVSPAILTSNVLAVTPLLARPYVEALLTLSGRDIVGKNFYRRLILGSFPALRHIPYAATGQPITEDAVRPKWLPQTRHELYHFFPDALQVLVRRVIAFKSASAEAHVSLQDSASAEIRHWDLFFRTEGASSKVELDGIVIDGSGIEDLHVRSVSLALSWTQQYLADADRDLSLVLAEGEAP